jgi:hypothetical protein
MPDVFTQWKEAYASHAINRKWSQVFPSGVRQGFWLSVTGTDEVTVGTSNPDGSTDPTNVALIERDGYHLTVREETPTTLSVPGADALYHVVVEADYAIGQTTTSQVKIVQDGNEAGHHVIVGSVVRGGGTLTALPKRDRQPAIFVPRTKRIVKSANETVTSSTALQPDDELSVFLFGGTFLFEAVLYSRQDEDQNKEEGGLDIKWAHNTNSTLVWRDLKNINTAGQGQFFNGNQRVTLADANTGAGVTVQEYLIKGRMQVNQPTPLTLEWAQERQNNNNRDTTIDKVSHLKLTRTTD